MGRYNPQGPSWGPIDIGITSIPVPYNQGGTGVTDDLANYHIWVDGARTDTYTADGSLARPYKTVLAALTAINADVGKSWVVNVASGTYSDNLTITGPRYLRIEAQGGVTLSGTILINSGVGSYDRIEFVGHVEGPRAEKGPGLTISGNITCTRTNDSLIYVGFSGCYVTGDLECTTNGTWVLQYKNCRVNGNIKGTFDGLTADQTILIETYGFNEFATGTISGKTSFYNCNGTDFYGTINTTPWYENKFQHCTFAGSISIVPQVGAASALIYIDDVSYKSLLARTPTITGATYSEIDNTHITSYATTFDTNVAAAGVTLSGTTLAADGTDDAISITITPKGTGSTVLSSGNVFIGDTANAKSTQGLTINQGANDDEIISLKSSDVSHSFTDITEADTYGLAIKASATTGGLNIKGFTDANAAGAIDIEGAIGAADPTDTNAAVIIRGSKLSTNTVGALAAAETVLQVKNRTTDLITVLGDGKVGIGTTAPGAKLHVERTTTGYPVARFTENGASEYTLLQIQNANSTASNVVIGTGGSSVTNSAFANKAVFGTTAGVAAPISLITNDSERLSITSTGNVGIGTTAPDKPLEVNAATGGAVRLTYNDANGSASTYVDLSVDSSGNLSISPTGKTIIMPDAGKILWDISPATDNTYSGNAESITMGATVALGDVLYQKSSDSEWYLAKADSSTTMPGLRLAVAAGADGAASAAIKEGYVYKSTWTWTPGMPIYVSTTGTTGNTLTQTAPTPSTYNAPVVVQQVGYALSATVIWFCPSLQTLEIGLDYVALGTADVTIYPAYLSSSPITFTGDHSSTQSLTLDTLSAADAGKTFTISKIGTGAGSLRLVLPTGCTAYSSASSSTSGGYVELNASARGTMTWRINSATDIQLISADGSLTFSS